MEIQEIRLKCLELAKATSADSAQVVERAKRYEIYVTGNKVETPAAKPLGLPKKN